MISCGENTFLVCLQLTKGPGSKKEFKLPDGKIEQINDEIMMDRIFSKSEEFIITPKGLVKGKQAIPMRYDYYNPFVLLLIKIVSEDEANIIANYERKCWNMEIDEMKRYPNYNSMQPVSKEQLKSKELESGDEH